MSAGAKLVMTVPEVGKLLGVSRNSAYELAARGELPTVRVGKRIFVPTRALDLLLDSAIEAWRLRRPQA